mgnify:CR=1 FL=1
MRHRNPLAGFGRHGLVVVRLLRLRVRAAGDDVFVTDLGSTNGTGLDGGTLAPQTEVSLSRGQQLTPGQAAIRGRCTW